MEYPLSGRRKIFTTVENITAENVVYVLNSLLAFHTSNREEEEYLFWYRRGIQPIWQRVKEVRPEINNKVAENHAAEVVAFKDGYFLTQPAFYTSRRKDASVTERVRELNEYLYLSGKQQADNAIVDWFHTVGLGVLYVEPTGDSERPVAAYALDPRNAFVAYSHRPGNAPVIGVNAVAIGDGAESDAGTVIFDVYTRAKVFRVRGSYTPSITMGTQLFATAVSVESEEPNLLGEIPIIEYQYENNRMGAFEGVIPLLDAINKVQSDRLNGIEQFIQSLMIFYNCQLGDDQDGNPITPRTIREAGAIFLKSVGQDRADLKILSEQLDQSQTQVLVDYLYQQAMMIAGVPMSSNSGRSTSDNVGAVYLRSGWATADTLARTTEDLFKTANKLFDRIMLKILRSKVGIDLKESDIDLQFTRNEMDNLLVKTQAALNLKQLGLSPELVLAKSGVSNDPAGDIERSRQYIDAAWTQESPTEMIEDIRTDVSAVE